MNVILISHTPQPERAVACAAKLCYSPSAISQVQEKLTDSNVKSFVKMLSELGHESPIEHVSFTFGIEGVSRAFLAQITRHRIASYSVQSQRYVKETQFEYVTPPEIAGIRAAEKEFLQAMTQAQVYYDNLVQILYKKHFEKLIQTNTDEKAAERAAEKNAIEDARFVLPNACETKMICTFNARSLLNFFAHRCCNRAQWEIREVAVQMLRLVKKVAPNLFLKAGPPCVFGKCKEGRMSCGKMAEVRERFKELTL